MLMRCNVYYDGYNYIANIPESRPARLCGGKRNKDERYEKFKGFYLEAAQKKITKRDIVEYIQDRFLETEDDIFDALLTDEEAKEYTDKYLANVHKRIKRLKRKAALGEWNWFITLTYSDDIMTEEEFEEKVSRTLSNFSTRRHWRYMAVWERGKKTERKHLHIVANIPEGEIPGDFNLVKSYSTTSHKWEFRNENSFFAETFGNNDFQALTDSESKKKTINYILKYITKTDAYVVYSRGIPEALQMFLNSDTDFVCEFYHKNARKAVVYDSVIDKESFEELFQNDLFATLQCFSLNVDFKSDLVLI